MSTPHAVPAAPPGVAPVRARPSRLRIGGLRVLVLLLALLVPSAHAAAHAVPTAIAVSGEAAECDLLETDVRPPSRSAHRDAVPLRPAPRRQAERPAPAVRWSFVQPPHARQSPHTLRSVVLRC